jgi:CRP-like cAMP-binding protein
MPHVDLLELPYFEGIAIDELAELIDTMTPAEFQHGEVIVEEGAPPPPLYIVVAGTVRISKRSPDGLERPLAEITAPTLFGEIELFCQIPAVATARAKDRVSCFRLVPCDFAKLLERQQPAITRFAVNVARVACHRLAIADEILASRLVADDLVALRRVVFGHLASRHGWSRTTGTFRSPLR